LQSQTLSNENIYYQQPPEIESKGKTSGEGKVFSYFSEAPPDKAAALQGKLLTTSEHHTMKKNPKFARQKEQELIRDGSRSFMEAK
jgi:hypothetical protein